VDVFALGRGRARQRIYDEMMLRRMAIVVGGRCLYRLQAVWAMMLMDQSDVVPVVPAEIATHPCQHNIQKHQKSMTDLVEHVHVQHGSMMMLSFYEDHPPPLVTRSRGSPVGPGCITKVSWICVQYRIGWLSTSLTQAGCFINVCCLGQMGHPK
jgi:hypothetical protein